MSRLPVVAIDGPSGAGKSTVARGVALALGFDLVDTGALYRAVAWLAADAGVDWHDGEALGRLALSHGFSFDSSGALFVDGKPVGDRIRTPEISLGASTVAPHPAVRAALLSVQRRLGAAGGVVLEGRDIGTVVFPDAKAKFFLTASTAVRAARRHAELASMGQNVSLEQVRRDQEARDEQDTTRAISPLRQAEDAQVVQCDDRTPEQVVGIIVSFIRKNFPLTSNSKA